MNLDRLRYSAQLALYFHANPNLDGASRRDIEQRKGGREFWESQNLPELLFKPQRRFRMFKQFCQEALDTIRELEAQEDDGSDRDDGDDDDDDNIDQSGSTHDDHSEDADDGSEVMSDRQRRGLMSDVDTDMNDEDDVEDSGALDEDSTLRSSLAHTTPHGSDEESMLD